MTFKLTIDMDNAAFKDANGSAELGRILTDLEDTIANASYFGEFDSDWHTIIRDLNGNEVGSARLLE